MALMPRPGTPVIPPTWEAHHRPTANGQMTAHCLITRPATEGVFDEVAGRTVYPPPANLYDGPCRAQASQRQDQQVTVGDAQATIHRYAIALPLVDTAFQVNDEVTVTECSDTWLVAHPLRIVDIPAGSLMWQRNLTCEELTPTTR